MVWEELMRGEVAQRPRLALGVDAGPWPTTAQGPMSMLRFPRQGERIHVTGGAAVLGRVDGDRCFLERVFSCATLMRHSDVARSTSPSAFSRSRPRVSAAGVR